MRTSRKVAVALGLAGAALPALGQDRPESILPPGFGQPQAQPSAPPTARPTGTDPSTAVVQPLPTPTPTESASATPSATPTPIDPKTLAYYELPPFARRSLASVGPVRSADGGLPPDAFGRADGQYLETLMRRLSAPLPSRWLSILLRRTLLSEVDTPAHADGANFAAERAWLLLRMGESVAARAVVQSVDNADYTPKLYQVALNAMLANGDPGGLCSLADRAAAVARERGWVMAQAMCAGLSGAPKEAGAQIAAARRRRTAAGIDLLLAQKVVGVGDNGRQAVTIEWNGVDRLTPWRFGLAAATGVAVPDELMATTGPQVGYWRALAPGVAQPARVAAADAAAAQGVLSNAALVDLYAALATSDDEDEPVPAAATAAAQDLNLAYSDRDADARLRAIKQLWGDTAPYGRLVLTARAAARIPATAERAGDADRLVASMLTAGLADGAERWRAIVPANGDAWAMLTLVGRGGAITYSDLASYSGGGDARLKQRLFFAGLAGLGQLSREDAERAAGALDVRIGEANSWTRAIDRAAAAGEAGTVVLLAGVGMQTASWRGVPPAALYRIVLALRAVGLESEARMIAAEAIARA